MASPHEKLAESLEVLRALQERGVVAVREPYSLNVATDARTNP